MLLSLCKKQQDYAAEVAWSLTDRTTGTVIRDVPFMTYPDGQDTASELVGPVVEGGLYTFQIRDLVGDGLCCEFPGDYTVSYEGIVLASGSGNYGLDDTTDFTLPAAP